MIPQSIIIVAKLALEARDEQNILKFKNVRSNILSNKENGEYSLMFRPPGTQKDSFSKLD